MRDLLKELGIYYIELNDNGEVVKLKGRTTSKQLRGE